MRAVAQGARAAEELSTGLFSSFLVISHHFRRPTTAFLIMCAGISHHRSDPALASRGALRGGKRL
jgi:hypothetical protein